MDIYIIQINMADPGQNPEWENCGAYQDREQALAKIDWMRSEYGAEIEYRIDVQIFYSEEH